MSGVSLNLVVIRSADLSKSLAFYQALGLEFTPERHGEGPAHYACGLGGTVLEIYPARGGSSDATRLGFRVPVVDQAVASIVRTGAAVLVQPGASPWGRRAVVTDPDGRRVELLEDTR